MTFAALLTNLQANGLEIGSTAPSVQVTDHTGNVVDLSELLSSGKVVVFFYPKADTPGCTKQACSLRDGWTQLKKRDVTVLGVSSDRPMSQKKFKEKYELPYQLLADTEQVVAKAFGKGRWSRQAYLFIDGIVAWRDLSASTERQLDDVLQALDQLESLALKE